MIMKIESFDIQNHMEYIYKIDMGIESYIKRRVT